MSTANLPEADEEGMDSPVGGHMGPPVVGIPNSLKMGGKRTVFLLDGPMGPRLRCRASWVQCKKDGIPYMLQNAILPNGRFRWGFRDIVSICGHYRMDRAYSVGVMPNFSLNCREK